MHAQELATVGHNSSQVESYIAPKKAAELHKMKEVGLLAKKPLKADAAETAQARPFPSHSALHSPVVTRCYSPKINWVVDEVKRSEREDKFLIFTSSRQAIFFLAETMDIAGALASLSVARFDFVTARAQASPTSCWSPRASTPSDANGTLNNFNTIRTSESSSSTSPSAVAASLSPPRIGWCS